MIAPGRKKSPWVEMKSPRVEKITLRSKESPSGVEKVDTRVGKVHPRVGEVDPRVEKVCPRVEEVDRGVERVAPRVALSSTRSKNPLLADSRGDSKVVDILLPALLGRRDCDPGSEQARLLPLSLRAGRHVIASARLPPEHPRRRRGPARHRRAPAEARRLARDRRVPLTGGRAEHESGFPVPNLRAFPPSGARSSVAALIRFCPPAGAPSSTPSTFMPSSPPTTAAPTRAISEFVFKIAVPQASSIGLHINEIEFVGASAAEVTMVTPEQGDYCVNSNGDSGRLAPSRRGKRQPTKVHEAWGAGRNMYRGTILDPLSGIAPPPPLPPQFSPRFWSLLKSVKMDRRGTPRPPRRGSPARGPGKERRSDTCAERICNLMGWAGTGASPGISVAPVAGYCGGGRGAFPRRGDVRVAFQELAEAGGAGGVADLPPPVREGVAPVLPLPRDQPLSDAHNYGDTTPITMATRRPRDADNYGDTTPIRRPYEAHATQDRKDGSGRPRSAAAVRAQARPPRPARALHPLLLQPRPGILHGWRLRPLQLPPSVPQTAKSTRVVRIPAAPAWFGG
eukprot:gene17030-biopygen12332